MTTQLAQTTLRRANVVVALSIAIVALAFTVFTSSCSTASCTTASRIVFAGPDGAPRGEFVVDIATTADARAQGLRGEPSLRSGTGLLLRYPVVSEACIVNSGVAFPIDVVFLDAGGTVLDVVRELPADDAQPNCTPDTLDVLEVNAIEARAILPGDQAFFVNVD